jgi:hypothetical protein
VDISRVEREAIMQQLHQFLGPNTLEQPVEEAPSPSAFGHFFAVLATGLTFVLAHVLTTLRARRTGHTYHPTSQSAVAMRALQPRMSEEWGDDDYAHLFSAMRHESENTKNRVLSGPPDDVLGCARAVYVVIFNEGTPNEGVYTLQSRDDPARTHLLTFEHTEDADRFASLLQGQGLPELGKPVLWDAENTKEYCNTCEYAVTHVPVGTMFTPPRNNSVDEDAFLVREMMRQAQSGEGLAAGRDIASLGLDMYISEREMLEKLYGPDNGFAP